MSCNCIICQCIAYVIILLIIPRLCYCLYRLYRLLKFLIKFLIKCIGFLIYHFRDHNNYLAKKVGLKAHCNDKFVSCDQMGLIWGIIPLIPNRDIMGCWEKFDIIFLNQKKNLVNIRQRHNKTYIGVNENENYILSSGSYKITKWNTFELGQLDGAWTFKCIGNNCYVCAQSKGKLSLIANRHKAKQWQKFYIYSTQQYIKQRLYDTSKRIILSTKGKCLRLWQKLIYQSNKVIRTYFIYQMYFQKIYLIKNQMQIIKHKVYFYMKNSNLISN